MPQIPIRHDACQTAVAPDHRHVADPVLHHVLACRGVIDRHETFRHELSHQHFFLLFPHGDTWRTVTTGRVAVRTTRSVTLPSMKRPSPPRPCVPITMYAAPSRSAIFTISSCGTPTHRRHRAVTPILARSRVPSAS